MMSTTNINIRVNTELKKSAELLFADLGLNMSTAITMFLKSAVNHNGIPFEVKRVVRDPLALGAMTQDELNVELEKAHQDVSEGRIEPAGAVFPDVLLCRTLKSFPSPDVLYSRTQQYFQSPHVLHGLG